VLRTEGGSASKFVSGLKSSTASAREFLTYQPPGERLDEWDQGARGNQLTEGKEELPQINTWDAIKMTLGLKKTLLPGNTRPERMGTQERAGL